MCRRSRNTILGSISVLALIAGGTVCFADAIDSRLVGAWAPSASDCARLFQRRGGVLSYRQPVDKFAQAALIEPQHILGPASTCRVRNVAVPEMISQCQSNATTLSVSRLRPCI
jgi:hypothetical protein